MGAMADDGARKWSSDEFTESLDKEEMRITNPATFEPNYFKRKLRTLLRLRDSRFQLQMSQKVLRTLRRDNLRTEMGMRRRILRLRGGEY